MKLLYPVAVILMVVAINLIWWGTIIYVASHFIGKFW